MTKTTIGRAWAARVSLVALGLGTAGAPAPANAQMPMMQHDLVVTPEWLEGHLAEEHVAILHADPDPARYGQGHLPGARFLDMRRLVWDGPEGWGTEVRPLEDVRAALVEAGVTDALHHVIVYAENPLVASRAFMTLEVMGLRGRVQVLDGGLSGWREEGRAVSTEAPPPAPGGTLTLRPLDDVIVSADWLNERLDDDRYALIDARPDDEYTGADNGMNGMTNPGHIPGARQMYWEELIESRALPRLRDREALRALFEEAGAGEGDTVVAYCMVGMRASFTYLVARMLGYETKFYDGSWHDWGTREDLPYVTGERARF